MDKALKLLLLSSFRCGQLFLVVATGRGYRTSVLLFVACFLVLFTALLLPLLLSECFFNLKVCISELDSVYLSELPIHPVP